MKKYSKMHERRLKFRHFVQNGKPKSVAEALNFARELNFPLSEHDIAHLVFLGKWRVESFAPTEDDRELRKSKREEVHAKIGDQIAKSYTDREIEVIEPWHPPS